MQGIIDYKKITIRRDDGTIETYILKFDKPIMFKEVRIRYYPERV